MEKARVKLDKLNRYFIVDKMMDCYLPIINFSFKEWGGNSRENMLRFEIVWVDRKVDVGKL